uniref:Splicing coactivator subunit-like n=1 Tax=Oryza sativa subsp. japonica TaxID=39947 RepID=Q8L679_ORYSJ|nr:hypothetical protein [Oryza sativa Japonica Group]
MGVGPTRQPLGPRWTGSTRLTPAGAVGPTRQPHLRAQAADGRAPHGSRGARPKAASPAQPTGGDAPAPLWSPAAAIGTAERRPREGREGGNEMGGPRLTPGRRRRRERRPEQKKAAARHGSTGTAAFRRSAGETEGWTRSARTRRSRRRRRRGGRRSEATTAADRSSAVTAERESDGASSIPAERESGEWRKRWREARGAFI